MAQDVRTELKGCPFCGRMPRVQACKIQHCQLHGDPYQDYKVMCPDCNIEIRKQTKEDAIQAWKTRALLNG